MFGADLQRISLCMSRTPISLILRRPEINTGLIKLLAPERIKLNVLNEVAHYFGTYADAQSQLYLLDENV